MLSLSEDNNLMLSTSRFLDDLLNIDNNFFDSMVTVFTLQNFSYIRST